MNIKKILLVDDNEADHFLHEMIIEELDASIEVSRAYDGQEALDLIDSGEDPDLILLDINMPGLGGFEFLDKYDCKQRPTVVVMLSSSSQEKDKERALQYECVKKYLIKPLKLSDLKVLVDDAAEI